MTTTIGFKAAENHAPTCMELKKAPLEGLKWMRSYQNQGLVQRLLLLAYRYFQFLFDNSSKIIQFF